MDDILDKISPTLQLHTLKARLSSTDYIVTKIAEGAATAEQYADVIQQRKEWRAELDKLGGGSVIYLRLDDAGYLQGIVYGEAFKSEEEETLPHINGLDGLDLSGVRMGAYQWDGEKLNFDEARYAVLLEEEKAAERTEAALAARQEAVKEVQAALITEQINTLSVDDATALRWRVLYPTWESLVGTRVEIVGMKCQYKDQLYKSMQAPFDVIATHTPDISASLWTKIDETHAGTIDDPIPYSGNMVLENGKYYSQDGVTYRCTRDTVNPVYNALADLVGLYVEVAA